jgi:Domain of unknown function (DUF4868)
MSIALLRARISEVITNEVCGAEFHFLLETDDQISIKRADVDEGAQTQLMQNFIESIRETILNNDELSLLDISSADDRAHAIYRYDLPEIPSQLTNLETVLQRDDFDVFDFKSDDLKHLQGILILLGHGKQQLVLYKHQYPVALLKRDSSFNLVRLGNQNRLVKLDDDILRINSKFEFMCVDDNYYIVDIKTLERFFGFHDAIRNVATQGITNITETGLVENTQPLIDRLDDISFSRKLVRAARASPVLGVIPNEHVITFIDTHPVLCGKFKLSEDGTKIKLDTKVSQNLFLKLLNDDFLQSELTKRYYSSLVKDNLEVGTLHSNPS